jgi:pilus assembly protein Flp/PilA
MRSATRIIRRIRGSVRRFIKSEDGPTTVEYAVMLMLIVMVCIGSVDFVGEEARGTFDAAARALEGAKGSKG